MNAPLLRIPTTQTSASIADSALSQHQKLQKYAQKLVAQTFYGTMLRQMRNSPFKSELFEGGRGAQAFNEMLDQHLADRMAKGKATKKLVDKLVKRLELRANEKSGKTLPAIPATPDLKGPVYQRNSYLHSPLNAGGQHVSADIRA